jgi:16S rRNA processing protein RimM
LQLKQLKHLLKKLQLKQQLKITTFPLPLGEGQGEGVMKKDRVAIAKISGVHGIKGFVKLSLFDDDTTLFNTPLFTTETGEKTLEITLKNRINKQYLAEIKGLTDRTLAEKLMGTILYTSRDALSEESIEHLDLIDMPVFTKSGQEMGTIIHIQNFGASDLLEIKPLNGASFYLPYTDSCVLEIKEDRVIIDPPEYV